MEGLSTAMRIQFTVIRGLLYREADAFKSTRPPGVPNDRSFVVGVGASGSQRQIFRRWGGSIRESAARLKFQQEISTRESLIPLRPAKLFSNCSREKAKPLSDFFIKKKPP